MVLKKPVTWVNGLMNFVVYGVEKARDMGKWVNEFHGSWC
jgi:hypothetical protein